jgi:hypothetical protein
MKANNLKSSDWMLTISTGLGLITPYLLPLIFGTLLTRKFITKIRWERHHTYLLLAIFWATAAYIFDEKSNLKALLPFAFYWSLPFLLIIKKVDESTIQTFSILIFTLLLIDATFNGITILLGADPLGRGLDLRDGTFGNRLGGLFAHSFYSISISICALTASINNKKYRWITVLCVANLLAIGSWRGIAAIPIFLILSFGWRKRSNTKTALLIVTISISTILATIATSNAANLISKPNDANDLRIFAWTNAIQNIYNSPVFGNNFPNQKDLEGIINEDVIAENFISESWYLSAASTFGIPYMLFMAAAYFSACFRGSKLTSNPAAAILLPYLLIDLTYGDSIQGTLMYTWAWLLISKRSKEETQKKSSLRF